jgi:hypothetical protein
MSQDPPEIPVKPSAEVSNSARLVLPAVLIVCGALLLLIVSPDGPGEDYLSIGYLLGTMFGHATLAAGWTAFGPGRFLWRMPLSLVWLGLNAFFVSMHGPGILLFLACTLGPWLLLQVPLGTLVLLYGLRLQSSAFDNAPARPLQFGIRQFMIFTAIVSVVLAIGRIGVIYLPQLTGAGADEFIFAFLAIAALVMTLPLILAALLPRYALPSVLVVLGLIGGGTLAELPLLNALGARGGGPDLYHFIWINVFTVVWILGIAGLLRWAGYRLGSRHSLV